MARTPTVTRRQFLLGAASIALLPHVPVRAQGTPVPAPASGMLAAVRLERLAAKRIDTFFARYRFEAGGHTPAFERVGTALMAAESGTITLVSDDPVALRPAGDIPAGTAAVPAEEIVLTTGDAVLVPNEARMSLRNDTGEPASLLALIVYGPYHEFSYTHPTELPGMTGVTRQVIGFSAGAFEEVPAILVIERDVVRPRGSAYSSTYRGMEIGAIDSGSARATFRSGTGWMTPNALRRTDLPVLPGDTQIPAGDIVQLDASDGYVSLDGSITWRATGEQPLVILRGQLIPIPQPVR